MASLSICNNSGKLSSSFSPSFQRVSVQFLQTHNKHTCSLPSTPRPLTVISMAPPKPGGGKAKKASVSRSSIFKNKKVASPSLSFGRTKIRAVGIVPEKASIGVLQEDEEEASVKFAFVSSVLLPDGTPDVQLRKACGGQKLRDIMLDANVELYGPYARPLLNCGGGGTCGTCLVEVVEGKELLNPRTDKENNHDELKRHPKNWRLACQAIVGKPDSRGMMVIQQLPEWKAHEWNYRGLPPIQEEEEKQ
ncbi:photosynthetic NDH subunit of subcomplex B 3, chloroplastic isoform X1 [Nicotiana tomentosiformis]|uniref:photosynthetic NDH subunit of subcomplex B 3, chloroplastic isoform X1 n=1 Tax=Nicotiana tomentosiformis TaxID=4098 RepID=UPI00051B29C3|nr:photosynthetic NDH subunit of subcomplex B 3, chloroplastic isoform X2 [Nicotiana tomentosiformis]